MTATPEIIERILNLVTGGARPASAAEAEGVDLESFEAWCRDTDLSERIAAAVSQARAATEIELRKKAPRAWLLQNPKPVIQQTPSEPQPRRRRGGRRPIKIDLNRLYKLAARGLTIEQIAAQLGMHRGTLFAQRRLNPAIYDAIERGQAAGIEEIANRLFEDGLAGNTTAQIFYLKARAGWRDQGPLVEVNNQQQNVHVAMDPQSSPARST